jgi:hypothetical protein
LDVGVQQLCVDTQTWPAVQWALAVHWTHRPPLQWVLVWPVQPLSVAQAPQVPLLQEGALSGQSALAVHCMQAPPAWHLPAVAPLRAAHSVLLPQARQANVVGSQTGVVATPHWLLAVQATQGPPAVLQCGVAGRPEHSASWVHPVQVLLAVHTGVLPPQSPLVRQGTQRPALGPAIGQAGSP